MEVLVNLVHDTMSNAELRRHSKGIILVGTFLIACKETQMRRHFARILWSSADGNEVIEGCAVRRWEEVEKSR